MFIHVPMMEIADKVAPGYIIELPKGNAKWIIKMMAFVEDKHHYTNSIRQKLSEIIIKAMGQSVSTWYLLLLFVDGDLNLTKCGWYVIDWGLDINDKPQMPNAKHNL